MKIAGGIRFTFIGLACVLASGPAHADDWPSRGLDPTFARSTTERSGAAFDVTGWNRVLTGRPGTLSSPAVADGVLVLGALDNMVRAYSASEGKPLWTFDAGGVVQASPAVRGGRVYVAALNGFLYALRLSDGTEVWRKEVGGLQHAAPTIVSSDKGDSLLVAGGFPQRLVARLSAATGETVWQSGADVLAQFINGSPVTDGNVVVVATLEGQVVAFDFATGQQVWTYQADGIVNMASPTLLDGRVFLLPGGTSERIYAIDLSTGKAIEGWPVTLPLTAPDVTGKSTSRQVAVSSMASAAGRLIFDLRIDDSLDTGTDGAPDIFVMRELTMAVDPANGNVVWQRPNGSRTLTSASGLPMNWLCPTPAAYASLDGGSPLVAVASSIDPIVRLLDATAGTVRGTLTVPGATGISPVLANGRLHTVSEAGELRTFGSAVNHAPELARRTGAAVVQDVDRVAPVVRWAAAMDADGDPVSYDVRVDSDGEVLENWSQRIVTGAGETLARLNDLTADTVYTVMVRARDRWGAWSDWSEPQLVRALKAPSVSVGGVPQMGLAAALAAAMPGSAITLGAGTFHLTETLRVPAGVTVEGAGPGLTILDAKGQATGVLLEGTVEGKSTEVRRLTIRGANIGVSVREARDARITNTIVRDCQEAGIEVSASGRATAVNLTLVANGRGARSFGELTLRNSLITGNTVGVTVDRPTAVVDTFNDVWANKTEVEGYTRAPEALAKAVGFQNYTLGDLKLLPKQPSTDRGDPTDDFSAEPAPNGGRINLGAYGGTAEAELSPVAAPPAQPMSPDDSAGGCTVAGPSSSGELDLASLLVKGLLALVGAVLVVRRRRKLGALVILLGFLSSRPSEAITCTWKGSSGSGGLFATAGNWTLGGTGGNAACPPGSSDTATFNTGSLACSIGSSITVNNLTLASSYTGTVTQAAGVTVTTNSNLSVGSGTFTGGTAKIVVYGNFSLTGGTFTSTSHRLEIWGSFTKSGSSTFNHGSGTTLLRSAGSQTFASGGAAFNDLYITDGLTGYWPMDETSGTNAANRSGYFTDLAYTNSPTQTSSSKPSITFDNPRYLVFNGSTNYIGATSYATYEPTAADSYTLAAWVNGTNIATAGYKGVLTFGRDTATWHGLWIEPSGGRWFSAAGPAYGSTATAGWHHIAIVQKGSGAGNRIYMYVDGADVTVGTPAASVGSAGGNIRFGASTAGEYFAGGIDDVRWYERALGATEISALAAGGQPTTGISTITLTGSPSTAGDFVLGSGNVFAMGSNNVTVAGNWWNEGMAVTSSSGTVTMNGTTSGQYIRTNTQSFPGLTISGSGSWSIGESASQLTVNGDYTQSAGTFTAPTALMDIGGAFNKTGGTFTHGSGTVLLRSTTSQNFASNGATFNNLIINDGMGAYYRLDEGSGSVATDWSGWGNDGSMINTPTWTSSSLPAMNFENSYAMTIATNKYVDVPTAVVNTASAFSACGWVKYSSLTGYQTLASIDGTNISAFYLQKDNVNKFRMTMYPSDSQAATGVFVTSTTTASASTWYHLCGTFDGTTITLYVNGASEASSAATGTWTGSGDTIIGASRWGSGTRTDYMAGNIDDVRFYKRALSAQEVAWLANGYQPHTASATHTLTGNPTVAGNFTLASGGLSAGSTAMTVAGNWWNYGGQYSASGGSVTFNGSGSTNRIRSGWDQFEDVNFNGSGTWKLSDRLEVSPARIITMTAGTLDTQGYTVRAGDINKIGSNTITPNGNTTVIASNADRTFDTGTFYNLQVEPVAATDMVAYWKLDEMQGTTAHDWSASGTDGTLTNGPAWVDTGLASGIQFDNPGALTFDGTNDYVTAATTAFTTNTAFSACAWVNSSSFAGASGYNYYLAKSHTVGSSFYLARRGDTTKFSFMMPSSDGGATTRADGTTIPSTSTWYHLCGVYTGSQIILYVNGSAEGTTSFSSGYSATGAVTIGAARTSSAMANYVAGMIDDVRIYDVALTAAQVKALAAGTYPSGMAGTPTLTLGSNTTVSNTFNMHNGTLATAGYTVAVNATGSVATVHSGTYSVGTTTNSFAGGLTVKLPGTLDMPSSGGIVQIGPGTASTKVLTIDGTLSASNTGAIIRKVTGSNNFTFKVGSASTSTPTLNITGLQVQNTDTSGMYINTVAGSTTTFTRFDNIAFSSGTGTQLLQIYAPTLYLVSNGCTFDSGVTATTTYNVTLTGDNATTETRAIFGGSTCASNKASCEAWENDGDTTDDGIGDTGTETVIQWTRAAMADTSGTIEGFPTAAFDWNNFTYYSTYVTYHDVGGGTADRLYVRSSAGVAKYYWDGPSGEDLIGAPRFETTTPGGIHYVYVATSANGAGKVYRLIDTPGSSTLVTDSSWGGLANPFPCSCTINTPLAMDNTNLYWGGNNGAEKFWTMGKTDRIVVGTSNQPLTITTAVSGAAPAMWVSGSTYAFMGSTSHFYKVNVSSQGITTDNNSPTGSVNGRLTVLSNKVYGTDNAGNLWVFSAGTFSTTLWSYHDNTNHNGCASGATCMITAPLYVDWQPGRVFYGDQDGHLYASYNSTGTTGAQLTGFPYRPGSSSDVFNTAAFYYSGILMAGTTTGNLYVMDLNAGSGPALIRTYKFGTSTKVSGIGYDSSTSRYMVATADATNKDGKLFYIDIVADPTSGSN